MTQAKPAVNSRRFSPVPECVDVYGVVFRHQAREAGQAVDGHHEDDAHYVPLQRFESRDVLSTADESVLSKAIVITLNRKQHT